MTKKMLIDAAQAEETRVAVADGGVLNEFDYESALRKQLKGSIFLAKVTRVEPSLQAAFVNFGRERHGFLSFSEIHIDYFRIPVSDREAILEEQRKEIEAIRAAEDAEDAEDDHEDGDSDSEYAEDNNDSVELAAPENEEDEENADSEDLNDNPKASKKSSKAKSSRKSAKVDQESIHEEMDEDDLDEDTIENISEDSESEPAEEQDTQKNDKRAGRGRYRKGRGRRRFQGRHGRGQSNEVDHVGGDVGEGDYYRPSLRRNYKIQEVVKRGQVMLVQAQKEERGKKGAAMTTYLSLPGRYCVLMPNSPRGGGVSRKIANGKERKRMREILRDLNVPDGMSVILRTAGTSRTKAEIKRDLDYLLRLWNEIRETTLNSMAPEIIYEEGNLIKRSIRDIYTGDIGEIHVSGKEAFDTAKKFMKMMIPSHAKKVKLYENDNIPLFHKYGVEDSISKIGDPHVPLKSGGSLVINPTEALVAVDVNSGRATKERHIEETALRTNLEAAEEMARQMRLRDLAGLVVIDFIDMENYKNNHKVENKLKDALKGDRARIQVGRISPFGLLELSRQRLNPSLTEAQFETCAHCNGLGYTRTTDSVAVNALRAAQTMAIEKGNRVLTLHVNNDVALYILNNKRKTMDHLEQQYGVKLLVTADRALSPSFYNVEQGVGEAYDTGMLSDVIIEKSEAQQKEDSHDKSSKNKKPNKGGRKANQKSDKIKKPAKFEKLDGEDNNHEDKEGLDKLAEDVKAPGKKTHKPPEKSSEKSSENTAENLKKNGGKSKNAAKDISAQDLNDNEDPKDIESKDSKAENKKSKTAETTKTKKKAPAKKSAAKKAEEPAPQSQAEKNKSSQDDNVINVDEVSPSKKKRGWWSR